MARKLTKRTWILLTLLPFLLAAGLLWQWLALQDVLTPRTVMAALAGVNQLRESIWTPISLLGAYLVGSLVVFPLTVLVAVTGLIFGHWWGLCLALAGTLIGSAVTYWLGHWMGRDTLMRYGGPRLNALADQLADRGVRTMVLVNLFPFVPFTLSNMAAGACRLRFRDYMLGSTIGILPGLAAVTLLGSKLTTLLHSDFKESAVTVVAAMGALLGVIFVTQRLTRCRA